MLSIGEFSKATGLTVKALRFYHEQGVLTPACVDSSSGYRYYAEGQLERARIVVQLRGWGFSVAETAAVLAQCSDDEDALAALSKRRAAIAKELRRGEETLAAIDQVVSNVQQPRLAMQNAVYEVVEKEIPAMKIAGVRMRGKYSECGRGFATIGRKFGRWICGKPMLLHYDAEFKEEDADFEACMPVRGGESTEEIEVRELPAVRAVSLLHLGPYEELGPAYAKAFEGARGRGLAVACPTREVYLKGPGMIFRGNPKKYLTEIQLVIDEGA